MREHLVLSRRAFVEIVIWRVPRPARSSTHPYKYRLAYIANQHCVLRFDNEAGKGDHKHVGERQVSYRFTDVDSLQSDFGRSEEAQERKVSTVTIGVSSLGDAQRRTAAAFLGKKQGARLSE